MVNFSAYLDSHERTELRPFYINYKELKKLLKYDSPPLGGVHNVGTFAVDGSIGNRDDGSDSDDDGKAPLLPTSSISERDGWMNEAFFSKLDTEVAKVEDWLADQIEQVQERIKSLKRQSRHLHIMLRVKDQNSSVALMSTPFERPKTLFGQLKWWFQQNRDLIHGRLDSDSATQQLKLAFGDAYRRLEVLMEFQLLNVNAVMKILKKHDKRYIGNSMKSTYTNALVNKAPCFWDSNVVPKLLEDVTAFFTAQFNSNTNDKSWKVLRARVQKKRHYWSAFRVGLCIGLLCQVAASVIHDIVEGKFERIYPNWVDMLIVYRGLLIPIVMLWLFGLNVYVWHRNSVNHVLVFGFDTHHHLSYHEILDMASILSAAWAMTILAQMWHHHKRDVFIDVYPAILSSFMLIYLCQPFRFFYRSARWWLLKTIFKVVTAPLHHVQFAHFFLADQWMSMAYMFRDIEFMICLYLSYDEGSCKSSHSGIVPLLTVLPPWWRFAQCIRRFFDTRKTSNLVNAGKYLSSIVVVLFSSLDSVYKVSSEWTIWRSCWICAIIVCTIVSFCWDVKMDWGLLQWSSTTKHRLLRPDLTYPIWTYYAAIIINGILRLSWIATIIPRSESTSQLINCVIIFLELVRRFLWNFFRIENEYSGEKRNHEMYTMADVAEMDEGYNQVKNSGISENVNEHSRNSSVSFYGSVNGSDME